MKLFESARDGRLRQRVQALGPFIFSFSLLALLWVVVLVSLSIQQQRITDDAQKQLRLINNGVVQHTRGLLQSIESKLQVIDHWVQAHPQNDPRHDPELAKLLSRLTDPTAGLMSLSFASEAGSGLAAQPGQAAWLSNMPAIHWPESGHMHIGTPLRGAPDQPWHWPISHRFDRPVAGVAGVVAWIDLAALSALHESLRDKPAGAIMLTRTDAVVIMRTPFDDTLIGRNLYKGPRPPRVLPASEPQGTFSYDGTLTNGISDRVASYERLGNYPVTVLVSQGLDETLATFHARRRMLIAGLAGVTLFALGFSVLLARSQRATRRSQAEFEALSQAFPLGIFRADMDGTTTYANDAYFQQL
ncbi:MAG TPA: hypothetical protein VHQ87_15195, partial [Rhizobacter sp.]|nr:hypothetical protein [Rhizobacter sp.]